MKKPKKIILPCVLLILALLIVWTLWGNTALQVSEYHIVSDRIPRGFDGFRIAQISDLHNTEFGEGNNELIERLSRTEPDIIVLTGDLIDSRKTDIDIALDFVRQAMEIASVYYVSGNHESGVGEYGHLKAGLSEAGAVVLENRKVQITLEGEHVTLMGIDDPSFREGYLFGDAASVARMEIENQRSDSDGYTILLSHRPELFDLYVETGMDLVFSGHAHGGQFRLPFLGGLVAPNQGFFPRYDAGRFTNENTTMIVSRGVGNSIFPIRFNNRPEIVLVTLGNSK